MERRNKATSIGELCRDVMRGVENKMASSDERAQPEMEATDRGDSRPPIAAAGGNRARMQKGKPRTRSGDQWVVRPPIKDRETNPPASLPGSREEKAAPGLKLVTICEPRRFTRLPQRGRGSHLVIVGGTDHGQSRHAKTVMPTQTIDHENSIAAEIQCW